jgi:MoaA/NifB/PqqE/SkfB family radical SAM enzyme/prolyl-tRNA editing enzyme YbaK/EbsC (Cys-tRNA(Pro) deacylase)
MEQTSEKRIEGVKIRGAADHSSESHVDNSAGVHSNLTENVMFKGLDFPWPEILNARETNQLLSFDLELTKACNLKCTYCYAESGQKRENELSLEEICAVIDQAVSMGAKKVVVIGGGEPLMYPHYFEVLERIREVGLDSITFTNGTMITQSVAKKLYDMHEDIAMKFNSFDEGVQDELAGGIEGTGAKIKGALKNLVEVGYGSDPSAPKLALETVVCRQNIDEIERIYHFCREHGMSPYVEALTIQGRAKDNRDRLAITPQESYELFKKLKEYDENEWSITWPLTSKIAGQTCKREFYSAYITTTGEVQPCAGVDISGGNIREKPLKEIIAKSDIFRLLRRIDEKIKEPCKTKCEHGCEEKCYGCRGTALHHTGDVLNPDPTCWHYLKQAEPQKALADLLMEFQVKYELIRHDQTGKTTELAKIALGEKSSNILKAILLKNAKSEYLGMIVAGDRKIDFDKLKDIAKSSGNFTSYKFSFATPEEIKAKLGFEKGGVPPFAFYLGGITTLVDEKVMQKEYVIGAGGSEFTGLKFAPKEFEKFRYVVADIGK